MHWRTGIGTNPRGEAPKLVQTNHERARADPQVDRHHAAGHGAAMQAAVAAAIDPSARRQKHLPQCHRRRPRPRARLCRKHPTTSGWEWGLRKEQELLAKILPDRARKGPLCRDLMRPSPMRLDRIPHGPARRGRMRQARTHRGRMRRGRMRRRQNRPRRIHLCRIHPRRTYLGPTRPTLKHVEQTR